MADTSRENPLTAATTFDGRAVSLREAARRLGISKQGVIQAVKEGRIASITIKVERVMVPVAELKKYRKWKRKPKIPAADRPSA